MANTLLMGAQWGDEGKGKIIDVLSEQADVVVRYQGGNNAGHTVKVGERVYVLHLIPSGILHDGKDCVIGNGVVVDPMALVKEIDELTEKGIDVAGRLWVSDRAHLIFPYHQALDAGRESAASGGRKIGTTKRGIGPAYADKAARVGLRAGDILEPDFAARLARRAEEANRQILAVGGTPVEVPAMMAASLAAVERMRPLVADTVTFLDRAMRAGKSVLLEGAQGTMLDIDFGTFPYVTSSNATAGGACTGTGIPPSRIDRVVGVIKAYTTRVGEGPFPTELTDAMGERLRQAGGEFGATTGRPRRCGWFDAVVARYAAIVNGVDFWAMTKLDVLDGVETLRVCRAYRCDGRTYDSMPSSARILARCEPVYEEWPGWMTPTSGVTRYEDLPAAARAYVEHLCEITGVKLGILSVGARRDSTLRIAL